MLEKNKNYQYENNSHCLVLGFGGHGSACSVDHIINNPEIKFDIILTPMDDGSCTGRIQKYFGQTLKSLKQYEFTPIISSEREPIALGDLKNNIKVWLNKTIDDPSKKLIINESFDLRSKNVEEFQYQFYKLAQIFPFLKKYWSSFCLISKNYLFTLKENGIESETSFGNLFLQTIYIQAENSRSFFDELKTNGLIPKNVNLYFLNEKQLTLNATTESRIELKNEAELDVWENDPVLLESYKLKNKEGKILDSDNIFNLNSELKKLFENYTNLYSKNSYILFPAGSISNLFPVVSVLEKHIKNLNLPIIWITNAFQQGNEQPLENQISTMHEKFSGNSCPLVIFGVSQDPFNFIDSEAKRSLYKDSYSKENKIQVSQQTVAEKVKEINHSTVYVPNLALEEVENAGLKYSTKFLDMMIRRSVLTWKQARNNSDCQDKEQQLKHFVDRMKGFIPRVYLREIYPTTENHKLNSNLKEYFLPIN